MLNKFCLTCVILLSYLPAAAHAHSEADWLHGMSDGAWLFFTSMQYSLLVVVTGLLNLRTTHYRIPYSVLTFSAGLSIGILLHYTGIKLTSIQTTAHVYLFVLGLIVLFDFNIRSAALASFYLTTGGLLGLAISADIENEMMKAAIWVSFLLLALTVFTASVLVSRLTHAGWQRIGVRVIASWAAAIAIISLIFQLIGLERVG
jgi:hydrogenase/urease accessory protein HupE